MRSILMVSFHILQAWRMPTKYNFYNLCSRRPSSCLYLPNSSSPRERISSSISHSHHYKFYNFNFSQPDFGLTCPKSMYHSKLAAGSSHISLDFCWKFSTDAYKSHVDPYNHNWPISNERVQSVKGYFDLIIIFFNPRYGQVRKRLKLPKGHHHHH